MGYPWRIFGVSYFMYLDMNLAGLNFYNPFITGDVPHEACSEYQQGHPNGIKTGGSGPVGGKSMH